MSRFVAFSTPQRIFEAHIPGISGVFGMAYCLALSAKNVPSKHPIPLNTSPKSLFSSYVILTLFSLSVSQLCPERKYPTILGNWLLTKKLSVCIALLSPICFLPCVLSG